MTIQRAGLFSGFIAILFTLLFYHQSVGLNLLIFETVLITLVFWCSGIRPATITGWVLISAVAITAVFTVLHASAFVIIMNIFAFLFWSGWLILPHGRSLFSMMVLAAANLVLAPFNTMDLIVNSGERKYPVGHWLKHIAYLVVPLFLVLVFLGLYSSASPYFEEVVNGVGTTFEKWLDLLIGNVDFSVVVVFILGCWIALLIFFRKGIQSIVHWDAVSPDFLVRQRRKSTTIFTGMLSLKTEFRAGIFLLVILNLMIFLQNLLDIWHVWIHFEWNGQYLRQFVHEGTWMLIFSILISIGIVLWIYRRNLNFYPNGRILKALSYVWLIQNVILLTSVVIRNSWYIYYFALAYKRIGVMLFLAMTLVGLVTVIIKISKAKTIFYLLKTNVMAAFIILVLASCVNWDTLIARYNFSRYRSSFVHLDWLSSLSDKALPELDKTPAELAGIKQVQDQIFNYDHRYMSPENYHQTILERKKRFNAEMTTRGFLSFNLADYRAWKQLTQTPN